MNPKKHQRKLVIFILLSILLHLSLFVVKWPTFKPVAKRPMTVERIILDDKNKQQIVDFTQPKDSTPPKESKYLSKKNQSVPTETKAPIIGKTQNSIPQTKALPKQEPAPKKKTLSMADLGIQKNFEPKREPSRSPSIARPPSTTDDYLPEVKVGAETALNTREFKFYSYFERIKERLRIYWEPVLQEKIQRLYGQGNTDLSENDLITKLHVVLNQKGELSKIVITKNSGYEEIDEAALIAFEKAAPFPNPPSGMIEDGKVQLTWSFVVQTKGLSNIFVFLSRR